MTEPLYGQRDWKQETDERELLAIRAFCELHPDDASFVRRNEPPAPDMTVLVNQQEVLVELTRYFEQGPHNEAWDCDQELKHFVRDNLDTDTAFEHMTLHFHWKTRKNRKFVIFKVRTSPQTGEQFVAELKRLIRSFSKHDEFTKIRFKPNRSLDVLQKYTNCHLAAAEDYPVVAKYLDCLILHYHPGVPSFLPRSALDARMTAIDRAEIARGVQQKHRNLPKYRETVGSQPVHLLFYTEGWPPTARLPRGAADVLTVIEYISKELLERESERFDAVWWGHDLLREAGAELFPIAYPAGVETV